MYEVIDPQGRRLFLTEREVAILAGRRPVPRSAKPTLLQRACCLLLLALLMPMLLLLFLVLGEDRETSENEEAPTCTGRGLIGPGF